MTEVDTLSESSWEQSLCGLLALAEALTQPPVSCLTSPGEPQDPHLESGTKNSAGFKWVSGRFDELKLSRIHCLSTLAMSATVTSLLLLCFAVQQ